jgi:predicted DNA-binding ribbon-helix-helix protein
VWLDFAAPHEHLIVDVTATIAPTNYIVPAVVGSFPLFGSMAMRAQQAKLETDLRTSSSLGMPFIKYVHEYYPFPLEDGGRLAPMAVDLVDRLAILVVVRRFISSMGTVDSLSLRYESYARTECVRRSTSISSRQFIGDVRREFMQNLSSVLRGTRSSYLRDALHECGAAVVACLLAPRD